MTEAQPSAPLTEPLPRGADRRRRPTPMFSRFLLFGRRKGGRRAGEDENMYVDRPGGWAIAAFVSLTVLSCADAYFTLDALSRGGEEANPLMRAALSLGNPAFVVLKSLVTIVAGAFLVLHKNWRLGRLCLGLALLGYAALTGYHLYGQLAALPPR